MSWILWRVTIELGFFGIHKLRKQIGHTPIEVRSVRTIGYSNLRSSRLDSYSR
jgi:hypothetical protein